MSSKMFAYRQRGLPCVSANLSRQQPVGVAPPINWGTFRGDITSLRSRMGFLLPPSLRFINYSYCDVQRWTSQKKTYRDVIAYLVAIHRERRELNRSYYIDPYGRDCKSLPEVVPPKAASAQKPEKGSKTEEKNARATLLKIAMNEAALRRENERRQNAMLWGKQTQDEKEFFADVKPPAQRQVSPHLYRPRNVRVKSEWTKNLELALAASRKKDVDDRVSRRLEKMSSHGDLVRMKMNDQIAENFAAMLSKQAEKDERLAERIKKIKESRRPLPALTPSGLQVNI